MECTVGGVVNCPNHIRKFIGLRSGEVVAAGVRWVGALHAAFAHEVDGAVGVWGKISSLTYHHICSGHSHVELFVKRAGD